MIQMEPGTRKHLWSEEDTHFFLQHIKDNYDHFINGTKRQFFIQFKDIYLEEKGVSIDLEQIENKWKSLVRHYKTIREHNSKPGNIRRRYT